MRQTSYKFQPKLILTLLTIVVISVMIMLGQWQLDRAAEKRKILSEYQHRQQMPIADFSTLNRDNSLVYRSTRIEGELDKERIVLLDNQMHAGKVGYHVYLMLRTKEGHSVMVNFGWIPANMDRTQLPEVNIEQPTNHIVGRIHPYPGIGIKLTTTNSAVPPHWPIVVPYLDEEIVARYFNVPAYPYIVQLDAAEEVGFVRDWPLIATQPEKHEAYAVQWFGMAIVLFIIYVVTHFKKSSTHIENEDKSESS